jgi:hypothetical protein
MPADNMTRLKSRFLTVIEEIVVPPKVTRL